jgi:light-regulated signal transduction histidine kinase (bacteriophytochrome)
VSDTLIALAYFSIPITLVYFVRKRRDLPFHWIFLCFGVFIIACGATHLMEVWTLWHANYWLSGIVKAVTALASVPTAVLLVRLIPKALSLPNPEDLRQMNDSLVMRTAELARSNAELEAANMELEAFSYSVSHDLRAPLRSIDGFSLALVEDYAEKLDARGTDYLNRVRAATQCMGALIDDLLNLSRVTRSNLARQRVDLSAMAESVAEGLQRSHVHRAVEFVIEDGMTAEGDPRLLRLVLENLIGNSWKFTSKHPRSRIEFGRQVSNGSSTYFVRDDGAGFDPATAGRLFGAFQRLHSTREFPGTGIGLATVQRVIHRHGGRVWAEGAVEKGAVVYFTLQSEQILAGGTKWKRE